MILSELTHTAFFQLRTTGAIRDSYSGKRDVTTSEVSYPCFYDLVSKALTDTENSHGILFDARVFLDDDAIVSNDDVFIRAEDAMGNVLSEESMKIVGIDRFSDDAGLHHLEVLLRNDAVS